MGSQKTVRDLRPSAGTRAREDVMTTLYPLDFHRRVEQRWAERSSTTADAHGSIAHARLAGQQPQRGPAREGTAQLIAGIRCGPRLQRHRACAILNRQAFGKPP